MVERGTTHCAVQREAQQRPLLVVSGFIHDVSDFINEHPGGQSLMLAKKGKDATAAFCGGLYEHSNAAHNVRAIWSSSWLSVTTKSDARSQLLSMMRVGVLYGGVERVGHVPPGERLKIVDSRAQWRGSPLN